MCDVDECEYNETADAMINQSRPARCELWLHKLATTRRREHAKALAMGPWVKVALTSENLLEEALTHIDAASLLIEVLVRRKAKSRREALTVASE